MCVCVLCIPLQTHNKKEVFPFYQDFIQRSKFVAVSGVSLRPAFKQLCGGGANTSGAVEVSHRNAKHVDSDSGQRMANRPGLLTYVQDYVNHHPKQDTLRQHQQQQLTKTMSERAVSMHKRRYACNQVDPMLQKDSADAQTTWGGKRQKKDDSPSADDDNLPYSQVAAGARKEKCPGCTTMVGHKLCSMQPRRCRRHRTMGALCPPHKTKNRVN